MENATTHNGISNYSYIQTKVIDLGKDGHHFALYKAHPYVVDRLEGLKVIRQFAGIRDNNFDGEFKEDILPEVFCALKREKPIKGVYRNLHPERISDRRRRLIHVFEDIEDHDDPDGVGGMSIFVFAKRLGGGLTDGLVGKTVSAIRKTFAAWRTANGGM